MGTRGESSDKAESQGREDRTFTRGGNLRETLGKQISVGTEDFRLVLR